MTRHELIYDLTNEQLEAKLQAMEARLNEHGNDIHAVAKELADSVQDGLANFIREESDPDYIRNEIGKIRWKIAHKGPAEARAF